MKKLLLTILLLLCFSSTVLAADPEDFAYRGIRLGDSYAQMVEKIGQPRIDHDKAVEGWLITYYFYKDTRIGIEGGKVVDMRIGDKAYTAKNGVKIGATPHKILQEYGKNTRQRDGGLIYYIYSNPEKPAEKLMLDISEGYLEEIRITNLAGELRLE